MAQLWIGEVEPWMDEGYVFHHMFAANPEISNIKLIKDKVTGQNSGYGFVEFRSQAVANQVLNDYNGQPIAGTTKRYRLNWGAHANDGGPDHSIFVGDLTPDVTESTLLSFFAQRYSSVRGAKVITDPVTNVPKGYGFVKFGDEAEQLRALTEMQGLYLTSRPMRVSTAKKGSMGASAGPPSAGDYDSDAANTTLYVGNLDLSVTEEQLRSIFTTFGELVYARISPGKGCGFVQFVYRANAEAALEQLNGMQCGSQRMKVAWGRTSNKSSGFGGNAVGMNSGGYVGPNQAAYSYAHHPMQAHHAPPPQYYQSYPQYPVVPPSQFYPKQFS